MTPQEFLKRAVKLSDGALFGFCTDFFRNTPDPEEAFIEIVSLGALKSMPGYKISYILDGLVRTGGKVDPGVLSAIRAYGKDPNDLNFRLLAASSNPEKTLEIIISRLPKEQISGFLWVAMLWTMPQSYTVTQKYLPLIHNEPVIAWDTHFMETLFRYIHEHWRHWSVPEDRIDLFIDHCEQNPALLTHLPSLKARLKDHSFNQ